MTNNNPSNTSHPMPAFRYASGGRVYVLHRTSSLPNHNTLLAIYASTLNGRATSYEVQILRWNEARTSIIGGKTINFEAKWRHPSNEDFGVFGWSYASLDAAERQFLQIIALISKKVGQNE